MNIKQESLKMWISQFINNPMEDGIKIRNIPIIINGEKKEVFELRWK